jgi:hypothetical protein
MQQRRLGRPLQLAKCEITPKLLSCPDMPTSTAAGGRGWGQGQELLKKGGRETGRHVCLEMHVS